MKITTVMFDWGGVLVESIINDMFADIAKQVGIDKEEFIAATTHLMPQFSLGALSEREFWDKAFPSNTKLKAGMYEQAFRKYVRPHKDVFAIAKTLKQKKYRIGFISNTEPPAVPVFESQAEYKLFEHPVFSCVEKVVKPDSAIYKRALKRLACKPSQAIFIDDRHENIVGAQSIGMQGIVYQNPTQLKQALAEQNVTF